MWHSGDCNGFVSHLRNHTGGSSPSTSPKQLMKKQKLATYKLVKFNFKDLPVEYHRCYPFTENDVFILLGEIHNMEGHCVITNQRTGQIYSGYHTENFVELTDDEI